VTETATPLIDGDPASIATLDACAAMVPCADVSIVIVPEVLAPEEAALPLVTATAPPSFASDDPADALKLAPWPNELDSAATRKCPALNVSAPPDDSIASPETEEPLLVDI
jgi:hypothetical protein